MATIKGIFEPFAEYVQEQLNLRKKIISNSKGNKIISRLEYDDEERIRVLSAYKRGNFMDIDNDDNIYFRVKNWID